MIPIQIGAADAAAAAAASAAVRIGSRQVLARCVYVHVRTCACMWTRVGVCATPVLDQEEAAGRHG